MATAFLDTNVFVYGYTSDARAEMSQSLAVEPYIISVQVLNEFANVMLGKLRHGWEEVEPMLAEIVDAAVAVRPITLGTHQRGIAITRRYRLQIYDGILLAAALEAGCDTLFSEDMQDGMVIEDRLKIINPFA